MNRPPAEVLKFSNRHLDLAARDEESVMGWRYEPRIVFSGGAAQDSSTSTETSTTTATPA